MLQADFASADCPFAEALRKALALAQLSELEKAHFDPKAKVEDWDDDHGRKVIIAVHERPLFEYLRLELAAAFVNDQLITVELRRSATEETIAVTDFLAYKGEDVVAA
jgi:hypothetical protein